MTDSIRSMARSVCRAVSAAGLVVAATLGTSVPASAATSAKAVTMTFALASSNVELHYGVKISGRAAYGKTGNAGTVDIYFAPKSAKPSYVKHLSLKVAGDGTFSGWDVTGQTEVVPSSKPEIKVYWPGAYAPGTYKAIYHGNSARQPATKYADLSVYEWNFHSGTGATTLWRNEAVCPGPVGATTCSYQSPTMTVGNGAIALGYGYRCADSGKLIFAFLNTPQNTKPVPRPNEAYRLPQWTEGPMGKGKLSHFGALVTGLSRTGHVYVNVPAGCSVNLTVNQWPAFKEQVS